MSYIHNNLYIIEHKDDEQTADSKFLRTCAYKIIHCSEECTNKSINMINKNISYNYKINLYEKCTNIARRRVWDKIFQC